MQAQPLKSSAQAALVDVVAMATALRLAVAAGTQGTQLRR
jgi:thiazole synthase ThiGH ThiG subunit